MAVYKSNKPTKDGRSWYFRAYKDGKQYESKKYFTKRDAQDEESSFIIKRDNPLNKPFNIVALQYFQELEKNQKPSTVYTYKKDYNRHIAPFFKETNISHINVNYIKKWAIEMKNKNISVAYMNKCRNILKGIFDYAIRNYELESNPVVIYGTFKEKKAKIIKDEEKIRFITKEQFDKFIAVVDDQMWKTFFIFAFYTGCRKGEIQALTWNDIDFENNIIKINKTLYEVGKNISINSTKNNYNRTIKMSKFLKDSLLYYKESIIRYSNFEEKWFVFGNVFNLKKSTIARKKHNYFEMSGIKEITMHEFRHSHVTLLINEYIAKCQQLNIKVDTTKFFLMMSSRMGHTVNVMQKTYMHLFPTVQDEIVELLDNL